MKVIRITAQQYHEMIQKSRSQGKPCKGSKSKEGLSSIHRCLVSLFRVPSGDLTNLCVSCEYFIWSVPHNFTFSQSTPEKAPQANPPHPHSEKVTIFVLKKKTLNQIVLVFPLFLIVCFSFSLENY